MKQQRIPGTRGGWPAELSEAYHRETGGHLAPGVIGKALSPVLKDLRQALPTSRYRYDPETQLFIAFGRWMRSDKRKYGVFYLAREIGEFLRGPGI